MTPPSQLAPKAFVSYSWDDNDHRLWVAAFATRLRQEGVEVTLDQWHAVPGDNLPLFMESAVHDADFVLMICTPAFKKKSNDRTGGAGYEGDIMTGEVFTSGNQRKFIPILRKGKWSDVAPTWLKGKYYIDLRNDPYAEEAFKDLLDTLLGKRPAVPPLGVPGQSAAGESNTLVELVALTDWLVSEIVSIESLSLTFGESRRVLGLIMKLRAALSTWTAKVEPALDPKVAEKLRAFYQRVEAFISEARYILPSPEEDKYTRDRERLKDHRYNVITSWEGLKEVLLDCAKNRPAFEKLRNDHDSLARFIGYADGPAVNAYISPRTVDLIRNAGPVEQELLRMIVAAENVTHEAFIGEGFPKAIVVESFNSLLRDEYLKTDDFHSFRTTPVGRRIIQDLLSKRAAAG